MAATGHDFGPYETWMQSCGLSLKHVARVESEFTAQTYIATDLDANQITAFRPGAMNHSHANRVPADGSIQHGVILQDGREGMLQHAEQFAAAGILVGAIRIAHQGTQMHYFTRAEFARRFRRQSDYRFSHQGYSQQGFS